MARLRKLPRSGHWEVDLISVPEISIKEVELAGMLLVVERGSGMARLAAPVTPGDDIGALVRQAAIEPVPPSRPARPRTIRCRRAHRAALVDVAAALGAKIVLTEDLPHIDELAGSLREHMVEGPPLIPSDPAPWQQLVARFVVAAPWTELSDSVRFRFAGGPEELGDAVGLVLGQAGEQLGFVLYPTTGDYEEFHQVALTGIPAFSDGFSCLCAHLDPVDELPPSHLEVVRRLGLVHHGLALRFFEMTADGVETPDPADEMACLVALQGVIEAWATHGSSLEVEVCPTRASTAEGAILVVNLPPDPFLDPLEPLLLEVSHQAYLTTATVDGVEHPSLALKMAKRDALRLRDLTEDVDAVSLELVDGQLEFVAWAGTDRLGVLTRIDDESEIRDHWGGRGKIALVISAGGAKRRGLRNRDLVSTRVVEVLEVEEVDSGMFDPRWSDHASWEGTPEEWPKASTVLLDFAEPLGIHEKTADEVEQASVLAALVWSAVVLADDADDAKPLRDLRHRVADAPEVAEIVETLIERKRRLFAQDPRLMMVGGVTRRGGRVDVNVLWTLPSGG